MKFTTALLALAMLAGCEENTYNSGNEVTVYAPLTPPSAAPDRCTVLVAPALQEIPDCAELMRQFTGGTCTPSEPIWVELLISPRPGARTTNVVGYCTWLKMRTAASNR